MSVSERTLPAGSVHTTKTAAPPGSSPLIEHVNCTECSEAVIHLGADVTAEMLGTCREMGDAKLLVHV